MATIKYKKINAHDGTSIRIALLTPEKKIQGVIQIIHGFGEGIKYYEDFAIFFAKEGYACVIHDQRGHGKMPDLISRQKQKSRGVVHSYEFLLKDIKNIRSEISKWYPNLPVILFGNSMGGNIVINFLLKEPREQYEGQYRKVILEAPWLRLYKPLPVHAVVAARYLGKISRKLAIKIHLKKDYISKNQEKIKRLKNDEIFHDRMSFRLFTEISDAGENAIKNASLITLPTLLLCAGEDKIVCPKAIKEFSENGNENIVFIEYLDGYHCLHADIINADVMDKMLDFCESDF